MSQQQFNSERRPLRVAIVGSGPAGFYALQALFKAPDLNVQVDMYDRLPVPFGLVRSGVAPDHPKIKNVMALYERLAERPEFRFFGNVEYGKDVTLADFRRLYDQVVFASGAQADRLLGIPGENLEGVHSAQRFVAWYNGDSGYSRLDLDLSAESVAVIGVGNVAADVARILCRLPQVLAKTDIADYALEALQRSAIKTVHVIGRRGPVQSAFSHPEIHELGEMAGASASTLPEEMQLDAASERELLDGTEDLRRRYQALKLLEGREEPEKPRRLVIRFCLSPVEIMGDSEGRVRALKVVRNALFVDEQGTVRSRPTGETEEIPCGLVFRSVGYKGVVLEGLPFDASAGVVPNEGGRVIDPESGQQLAGVYVAGWIKRGPTGLIGANKSCARETIDALIDDLGAAKHFSPTNPQADAVDQLLRERRIDYVTYDEWKRIDELEVARGKAVDRPRVKLTELVDFLHVAHPDGNAE
ncbi:MAG: FAD-dependent oxidoreductase [Acidobacteria bacterium]|nr:FAD-dependent oxidoreductase [Acidobacteriota bacterium]MDA1234617.1 FAD-dependent oxidoreductase [Acidobacteriota bacterium]